MTGKHEPNTPGWKDGGYECYDINGAFRAFHLDALIVHPRVFKKKQSYSNCGAILDKVVKHNGVVTKQASIWIKVRSCVLQC